MRVIVNEEDGKGVDLSLPSGLVLNPVSAIVLEKICRKHGVELPRKQLAEFMKAVKEYKKTHPEWKLIEVDEADGEHVEIVI